MDKETLIKKIINCAYEVHEQLTPGYLESVYRNALIHELHLQSLNAQMEVPIIVKYKDIIVGDFKADIIVNNTVILELKAVSTTNVQHEIQLVNYLNATGIDDGLLINFGTPKIEIKRKYRQYKPIP